MINDDDENADGDDNLSYVSENNEEQVVESQEVCERQATPPIAEYTEAELNGIVEFVRRMTLLYRMNKNDWSPSCSATVHAWLKSSNNFLLTLYYDRGVLVAAQEIPTVPVFDLMYFLRDARTKFTLDNFHDEVSYGRMHEDVEGTILTLVEKLYAPTILNSPEWDAKTRSALAGNFQTFLADMSRLHYLMSGMVWLYVPQHMVTVPCEDAIKDPVLMKHVEQIAEHWIEGFRSCLCDKVRISPYNSANLYDDHDFWQYRHEILTGVQHQVRQKDFVHVYSILQRAQSIFVKPIQALIAFTGTQKKAALNNICYTRVLTMRCETLNAIGPITEAISCLPKFIYTIIYVNTKFIKTHADSPELICKMSNQIILYCQNRIDVQEALNGKPSLGIRKANEAIDLCLSYKIMFKRIAKSLTSAAHLRDSDIFIHLDLFVRRLYDFIEICQGIRIFEQINEESEIVRLDARFGGIRGPEFELCCANIKTNFTAGMERIRGAESNLLDIHNTENGWNEKIDEYKKMIVHLEETIENLIRNVFIEIQNIEEGIEALGALYYYSLHPNIRTPYMRKTIKVWEMFEDELHLTNQLLLDSLQTRNVHIGQYAARASDLASNRDRMARLRKMFEQADWMPEYAFGEKILAKHAEMDAKMTVKIKSLYDKWLDLNRTEAMSKLNRTLMARSVTHPGLLECNISHTIFEINQEAYFFKILGFGIPVHINQFYAHRSFKIYYDTVIRLLVEYNRILIAMSEKERLLFRCLIQVCDGAFLPIIYRLMWNSECLDQVMAECTRQVEDLKLLVRIYRKVNRKIIAACEEIADMCLVQLEPNHSSDTHFDSLTKKFKVHREENSLNLLRTQNFVTELLLLVMGGFEPHMANMANIWHKYVMKFDNLLLKSLEICTRNALKKVYEILHCDGTTKQTFLLRVDVKLSNQKLTMVPNADQIYDFFSSIHGRQKLSISHVPRLCDKMGLKRADKHCEYVQLIQEDEECNRLQRLIIDELRFNREQVNTYMKQWTPFADIWELDKTIFLTKYKEINKSFPVKELISNFERYLDIINRIFFREITTSMQFLLIDCSDFRRGLYEEIQNWWAAVKSFEPDQNQENE